jgi:hypothetical protein
MNIILQSRTSINNVKKLNSLNDIDIVKNRLFYELGHYIVLSSYRDKDGYIVENKKWIKEGIFKEVDNIKEFINFHVNMSKKELKEYIKHHNFVIDNLIK